MKTVYKNVYINRLNDYVVKEYPKNWHYGEIPAEKTKEFTADDLKNGVFGFHARNGLIFRNKWTFFIDGYYSGVAEKEFRNASETVKSIKITPPYTMKDLFEKLPVEEFLAWCKDNNVENFLIN